MTFSLFICERGCKIIAPGLQELGEDGVRHSMHSSFISHPPPVAWWALLSDQLVKEWSQAGFGHDYHMVAFRSAWDGYWPPSGQVSSQLPWILVFIFIFSRGMWQGREELLMNILFNNGR